VNIPGADRQQDPGLIAGRATSDESNQAINRHLYQTPVAAGGHS
jgi:hypothetical protein